MSGPRIGGVRFRISWDDGERRMQHLLNVYKREQGKKAKVLRREGKIPAVLYSKGRETKDLYVHSQEFEGLKRDRRGESLASFLLKVSLEGSESTVVVKSVQCDRMSYKEMHIDFQEIRDGVPTKVRVPLQIIGKDHSRGVKAGGVVRKVIHHLKVEVTGQEFPSHLELDISGTDLGESKRVSDVVVPSGVKVLSPPDEVAAVIARR